MYQTFSHPTLQDNLKDASFEDFLTVAFFLIDEMVSPLAWLVKRPGTKPEFADSEVICLHLVGQMFNSSQAAWHAFVKKNYLHLFPRLPERSRYHRRCKDLQHLVRVLQQLLVSLTGGHREQWHVIDSMPVPVCRRARAGRNLRFAAESGVDIDQLFGHCASQKLDIFGFKLHLLTDTRGVPIHFVLAPAAPHDVTVAPDVLESYRDYLSVLMDRGYVGIENRLEAPGLYELVVQKRRSQKQDNTPEEKTLLARFRKIIETANSQLTDQFNIQYTRAKSFFGLTDRITAKITAFNFLIYINYISGLPLLQVKNYIF